MVSKGSYCLAHSSLQEDDEDDGDEHVGTVQIVGLIFRSESLETEEVRGDGKGNQGVAQNPVDFVRPTAWDLSFVPHAV